jgi:hypothetical protein
MNVFDDILRKMFAPKKAEVTDDGENYMMGNFVICIFHQTLLR